ncbi:MAG TPA: RNA polymerase sigma factor [Pedobacter sp.]|uniref:RNA polymerase sigma factor n=1 Tax=Pedobacter sp. TaxID=1411316 RepID=UPI002B6D0DAC|nr:RNA polymerase sigma factor [Pedobacter sp.]HMI05096.1 RNA polymerase sigma factor [Pedobacter sp.]
MTEKKEKFIEVLKDHKKILFKIINVYCRDPEDQRDLEQEILIQIWKALDSFDESKSKLSTWIYRIALNVSISHYRKDHKRKERTIAIDESILEVVDTNGSDPALENHISFLYDCIRALDNLNKAVIILHLEGKSYQEIGELLGISESNAGTKINRIRKILKEQFKLKLKYGII